MQRAACCRMLSFIRTPCAGATMRMTMLLQPVDRLDEAVDFYRDRLGFQERFRDGNRFAMLDTGSLPLALVAGDERLVDQPALAFSVNDVDQALSELTQ